MINDKYKKVYNKTHIINKIINLVMYFLNIYYLLKKKRHTTKYENNKLVYNIEINKTKTNNIN